MNKLISLCLLAISSTPIILASNENTNIVVNSTNIIAKEEFCENVLFDLEIQYPTLDIYDVKLEFQTFYLKQKLSDDIFNFDLLNNNFKKITLEIPTRYFLDENGIRCEITISNKNNNILFNLDFVLHFLAKQEYDLSLVNEVESIYGYKIVNNELIELKESIKYIDTNIEKDDSYFKYNIDRYQFIYNGPDFANLGVGNIRFLDSIDGFPIKRAPLVAYKENNVIKLRFMDTYYVNPETLEMSLFAKAGFIQTNDIYFQKDKINNFYGKRIKLEFYDVGVSHLYFNLTYNYYPSISLFGNCNDSQYCLIGGVR